MARVLVLEPDRELRALFARQLVSIGHEAVADGEPDAVLVEPADPAMLRQALALRNARPELPIICVSIADDPRVAHELQPSSFLVKPFAVGMLRVALEAALTPV